MTVHGLHTRISQVYPIDSKQSCNPPRHTETSTLTLEGFQESLAEKGEREGPERKIFSYMVSKQAFSIEDGSILKELKAFFAVSKNDWEQDPSAIYYMEILDENPDSNDTMRHLAELLLDNVTSDHQGNYVILVGESL